VHLVGDCCLFQSLPFSDLTTAKVKMPASHHQGGFSQGNMHLAGQLACRLLMPMCRSPSRKAGSEVPIVGINYYSRLKGRPKCTRIGTCPFIASRRSSSNSPLETISLYCRSTDISKPPIFVQGSSRQPLSCSRALYFLSALHRICWIATFQHGPHLCMPWHPTLFACDGS